MRKLSPSERTALRWSLRLIGLALFAWIVSRMDVGRMAERLSKEADLWLAMWAVFITVFVLAVKAYRWKLILSGLGIEVGYWQVVRLYAVGWYGGAVSPGQLGEFFRIIDIVREGNSLADAFLSSLLDRLLDLSMLVLLGLAALHFMLGVPLILPAAVVLFALAALSVLVLWMRRKGMSRFIDRWADRVLSRMGQQNRDLFKSHLSLLATRPWELLGLPLALSALAAAIIAFRSVMMGYAVGIHVAPQYLFLAGAGASLMAILPISIQGIGTRDAAMIYLLGLVGVEKEAAFSFSVFYLAIMLMHGLIGWVVWTATSSKRRPGGDRDSPDRPISPE